MAHFSKMLLFTALFWACSCSAPTAYDLRKRGEKEAHALAEEMREIHSQEELKASLPKLRKKYIRLAKLILAVRQLQQREPLAAPLPGPSFASDALYAEIARLYELPKGRELIEAAQEEALKLLGPA